MTWHKKLFRLLVLLMPVQLGKHFWPQWSYVFGLRVDYLSPTIFLTDLLVFLILGLWVLEKPKIKIGRVFFLPFSIFIFLLISSALAQNPEVALYKSLKILEFSLLAFYVAKNNYTLKTIRHTLPWAVIYSSLIAIVQFIRQSSLNGIFWFLGERTFNSGTPGIAKTVIAGRLLMRSYGTFPHPNALAGFILVSLLLTLPYLAKKHKLFAISYLLLALVCLTLTFSRSAWLVGGLILGWYFFKKRKILLITYCLLLIIVVSFIFFRLPADESFFQRQELTNVALKMVKQFPLSGVGLNNFLVHLPDYWQPRNQILWFQPVHNIYLLVLTETGITGLLIFLFLIIKTLRNSLKIARLPAGQGNWELKIAFLAILLTGMVDHYWLTLQQNQLLFVIALGLSCAKITS